MSIFVFLSVISHSIFSHNHNFHFYSRTICGIILTLCLFGTILELLIDWLESPLSCIKDQRMHTLPATHATAYKVNGANIVDDTNSLGSQNSLSDDVEQLIQSSPTKTSAKGIVSFLISHYVFNFLIKHNNYQWSPTQGYLWSYMKSNASAKLQSDYKIIVFSNVHWSPVGNRVIDISIRSKYKVILAFPLQLRL